MKHSIKIKRVYEDASKEDGYRVLVDRLWPRGVEKKDAAIDEWNKNLAPSGELRKWYGHDPEKWAEFQKAYRAELKDSKAAETFAAAHKDKKIITLVYAAKDEEHTHALVLQQYLKQLE